MKKTMISFANLFSENEIKDVTACQHSYRLIWPAGTTNLFQDVCNVLLYVSRVITPFSEVVDADRIFLKNPGTSIY